MRTKAAVIIGLAVSTVAVALAAEVAQTHILNAHQSFKKGPTLLKIKSDGEVVAELRLLKPTRVDIKGISTPQTGGVLRTAEGGQIEIAPDGLSAWRLSGPGLEVETVDLKNEKQ